MSYLLRKLIEIKAFFILRVVTVSLPSEEEIETLANNMIFVSEEKMKDIEIYRDGFIDGMTQLKDMVTGNER